MRAGHRGRFRLPQELAQRSRVPRDVVVAHKSKPELQAHAAAPNEHGVGAPAGDYGNEGLGRQCGHDDVGQAR